MTENKSTVFIEVTVLIIAVIFFIAAFGIAFRTHFNVPHIKPEEFNSWIEENQPHIIDLREKKEIDRFPLNYSKLTNLPFLELIYKYKKYKFPSHGKILFVCSDGNRARLISHLLDESGIHTFYLQSGLHSDNNFKNSVRNEKPYSQ